MTVVWGILKFVGMSLLLAAGSFLIFGFLREYVFSKIKVNKWIILCLAILCMVMPAIFKIGYNGILGRFVFPVIYVILFLWFIESTGFFNKVGDTANARQNQKRKEQDVIRPKAKPNRVKKNK